MSEVSVIDWHSYGPGRGIAALSLPGAATFVVATVGLPPIPASIYENYARNLGVDCDEPGLDDGLSKLSLEVPRFTVWDREFYDSEFHASEIGDLEKSGDKGGGILPPYGVIFQILVDLMDLSADSPAELIDILMGAESKALPQGVVIHVTPVPEVLGLFPEIRLYGHEDFYISNNSDEVLVPQVQRGMSQVALLSSSANSHLINLETRVNLVSILSRVGALVPFNGFIRAAFDSDPRSIFMAIYR
ncbi:MAG: hypothetical protein EON54_10900, partial [Alcaligenaceae bacterium]